MNKFKDKNFNKIETIKQLVDYIQCEHTNRVLFKYFDSDKQVTDMTYDEFAKKVNFLSAAFDSFSLTRKRIAVVGESCPEWVMTYMATISLGSVIIPLDKELDVTELFNFLKISKADAIVFTGSFCKKFKENMLDNNLKLQFFPISCDDEEIIAASNVTTFSKLLEIGEAKVNSGYTVPDYELSDEMREMLFTSGTTGTSKCVMLSEKNVVSCVNSCCSSVDFSGDDVIVSVLPLHHTYELAVMIAAINLGATVCINDSLKYVLRNFKMFRPTGLVLVPLFVNTMYKKIMDEAKKTGQLKKMKIGMVLSDNLMKIGVDIRPKLFSKVLSAFGGRLTKIVCGGAALNPEYADAFKTFGINIYEGYGITECSPLISVNPYTAPKRGSVGTPVPCCSVKIDGENQNSKGYIEGEILVTGDNVMLGYYENEDANSDAFTDDGYFRTGDIGYMDNDGYIYITGRKKSVIVLENGKNVFPEEIEEYLSEIDTISECVVVGRIEGESVVLTAVVYPAFDKFDKNADISEVSESIKNSINKINKKLPSFKQVRNVELRRNEFEKTTTRKIKRFLVK